WLRQRRKIDLPDTAAKVELAPLGRHFLKQLYALEIVLSGFFRLGFVPSANYHRKFLIVLICRRKHFAVGVDQKVAALQTCYSNRNPFDYVDANAVRQHPRY